MESTRQSLPPLQNLDLQLSRLEDDLRKTDQLKVLDKTSIAELGIFRSQLNQFKSEIFRSNSSAQTKKIVDTYRNVFTIHNDSKFIKSSSLAEHLAELLFLMGSLGKIYDFTYGTSTITSILSWSSIALGLCARGIAKMVNSVNFQMQKLDALEKQINKPLYQIIKKEKLSNFESKAFDYLDTRVKFFKSNFKSINSIMLHYPTPTPVLRLMLDCYSAIHQYDDKEIDEMRQMIDGCFAYHYLINGGLNDDQEALYQELFEDITPRNKVNRLTPQGSENGLIL